MSILGKLFGSDAPPEWASFMSPADWRDFSKLLKEALGRYAPGYSLDLQAGIWRTAGESHDRGLMNAAQLFFQTDPANRREMLMDFVRTSTNLPLSSESPSFEEAKDKLRVRLMPLDIPAADLVLAPISDAFYTALFLDYPTHTSSVTTEMSKEWAIGNEELFSIAMENVWNLEKPDQQSSIDLGGSTMEFMAGDSFYTATHCLLLGRYPGETEFGTLVAVPHRHAVLYHRITGREAIDVINKLPIMARGMYTEGPGSVSPEVFWVRNEVFRVLPFRQEGEQLVFDVPEDFAEVLEQITTEG